MDNSLKNDFIQKWEKYFPGATLPVAAFYSNTLHGSEPAEKVKQHRCIIADLVIVSRGKSLAFNKGNIGCGGAMIYCGFSDTHGPDFEYFLSYGIPGKVEGERYKKDPSTVKEFMKENQKMKAPADWLILKPFDQLEEDDHPGILIFLAKPDVLSGLFTLANYDRTDPYGVKTPFGSGCSTSIMEPFLENKKDEPDCILGMFDVSARPFVPKEVFSFAIPMKRFEMLVSYMDESFLITPSWGSVRKRSGK